MKKKQKFNDIQQANAQIIQQKNVKVKQVVDDGPLKNYVVEKSGQKPDIFGNGPTYDVENNQAKKGFDADFGEPPGNPQISQTRIIHEISSELKNNFKEEITKLREEMNSQQRAFREQLDRLKIEAVKSNSQKQDAMSEIERVKAELRAQREAERMQEQKLMVALNKYDPNKPPAPMDLLNNYDKPGAFPVVKQQDSFNGINQQAPFPAYGPPVNMGSSFYNNRKLGGSRQESRESQRRKEINNYEKMFFGNDAKKSQSQSRDELKKPTYNIKEEKMVNFNQDYFTPVDYGGNSYQPKIMKRAESAINNIDFGASLNAESTLLPFSQKQNPKELEEHQQFMQPQIQPQMPTFNPVYDVGPQSMKPHLNMRYEEGIKNKENKQSNGEPFDYLDHLNKMGAGDIRLNTESEDTMDFINRIVNGDKKKNPEEKYLKQNEKKEERFADKLDNFNFNLPQIPAYEGFQQNLLKLDSKPQPQYREQQFNTTLETKKEEYKPDIFAKNYLNSGQITLTENTMNSMGTLNSLNLDKLNKRNEDRMAKLGLAYDQFDYTQNTQVNIGELDSFQTSPDKPLQSQQQRPQQKPEGNDDLKKIDSLLFDILRTSDGSGPGIDKTLNTRVNSSGGRIPHINSSNNYQNFQKMRETRDQFIVPKLGQISEDGGEDFDGTFKQSKKFQGGGGGGGIGIQLPTDVRRLDSLLDTTSLELK